MTGSDSLVSRSTRTRSVLLAAALLAALGMFSLFVARAEAINLPATNFPLPGSNFQGGDGNQANPTAPADANNPAPFPATYDWQHIAGLATHFPDPNLNDTIFTGGDNGKVEDPNHWSFKTQDGGSTPGKNNILDAYSRVDPDTDDLFLYLAFTRGDPNGTTYMGFELNQRADKWTNAEGVEIPCRTTGDIIVAARATGNDIDLSLERWTTTPGDVDPVSGCARTGTLSVFNTFTANVDAQGHMNEVAIQNYLPSSFPWAGNQIPEKLFGEAALNLTTLLEGATGSPCFSFGSIWMHTRASTSITSNLDDFIAPQPLLVRTCTASGTKFHDLNANGVKDTGEPGLAGFRMWADYDNDGVRDAGEPFDDTDSSGAYVITNVQDPSGTYSIREQLTPPATGTGGWICSFPATTGTNGDFPCSHNGIDGATTPNASGKDFGNYKKATVIVEKQTVPDGAAGSFAFTSTIPGKANFNLTDGQQNSTEVTPGVFTATETVPAGWSLTDITCSGDTIEPNSSDADSTATFNAQSGETITCVFENTKHASLTVVKETDPASDPQDFDFDLTGTGLPGDLDLDTDAGDGALASSQTFNLNAAQLGAKTVIESAVAGWTLTDLECTGAGADSSTDVDARTATLDIDAGESVVCTFTNTKHATVKVVKDARPDDPQDFGFTGSFGAFTLDDDGASGSATPNETTFTVSAAQLGAKTVTEDEVDGWTLTGVDCTNTNETTNLVNRTTSFTVGAGDTIVCTFTNTKDATVEIVKDAVPDNDPQDFSYTTSGLGAGFDLDDDGDEGNTLQSSKTITVSGTDFGPKSVTETDEPGWDLTDLDCEGDTDFERDGATANLDVNPGETIVCTFENTKRGSVTVTKTEAGGTPEGTWTFRLTGGPDNVDITKDTDADGNPLSFGNLKPGNYTLCEINMPAGWHSSLEEPPFNGDVTDNPDDTTTVCVDIVLEAGEAETLTVDNTKPSTLVIKEGNLLVHHGDTITYTFNVSNSGNTPLENVSVEDPRCDSAPVRDEANDSNADNDALLENPGVNGTSSEVWRFTCTGAVPEEHSDEEENPIHNVATAHAFDLAGNEVTAQDDHDTTIIHPAIAVNKTLRREGDSEYSDGELGDDPIKVHVGDTIEYRFEVTNEGDTPLSVDFSDPRCDAGTLNGPTGDDGDAKLEVGETWVYTCSHVVTDEDPDPLPNTVTVTGTDTLGGDKGTVTDSDTEEADILHPDIEVDKKVRVLNTGEFVDSGLKAHVGDTLEYQFQVTDGDSDTPIGNVTLVDPRCDAQTLSGPVKSGGDQDALLEDGETWTYKCTHVITDQDPNPLPNTATASGEDELGATVEDQDSTSVVILKPGTLVVKEGNVFAYPGDTVTFTFAVTNSGNTPLSDVKVEDDRCAPVTGPTQKLDGDQDDLLEVGEKWMFTCSKQIPADHKIGDENPIRNIATATGKDELGKTVTATDDHLVTVLHPAIDIEKTGPATATVGDALNYTLTVTNPGDVPFASQQVIVTDPKCEAPPAGPNTGTDATPNQLDPGDTWTYTCTAQTAGQPAGTFVNTANVKGTDSNGREVTDTDDFPTILEAQAVLPVTPGSAQLRGPSGCVRGPFRATVRGSRIARVTFFLDGKRFKRITAPTGEGNRFSVSINPRGRGFGVHRVTVRVEFAAASQTRARTLRLSFQRCKRQVVRPRFTG